MDEHEITCVVKDEYGTVSHYGGKDYGVQDTLIIEKLIREEACTFFIYEGDRKRGIYMQELLQLEQPFLQLIPMDPIWIL